ncbi:hypothetical protein DIPPA_20491 [Diplonema papillatum]|nr:hypothetical protein DIPPA_20491 [Diplonema papillatum]
MYAIAMLSPVGDDPSEVQPHWRQMPTDPKVEQRRILEVRRTAHRVRVRPGDVLTEAAVVECAAQYLSFPDFSAVLRTCYKVNRAWDTQLAWKAQCRHHTAQPPPAEDYRSHLRHLFARRQAERAAPTPPPASPSGAPSPAARDPRKLRNCPPGGVDDCAPAAACPDAAAGGGPGGGARLRRPKKLLVAAGGRGGSGGADGDQASSPAPSGAPAARLPAHSAPAAPGPPVSSPAPPEKAAVGCDEVEQLAAAGSVTERLLARAGGDDAAALHAQPVRAAQGSVGNPCPPVSSPAPCGCDKAEQLAAAGSVTEHLLARAGGGDAAALHGSRALPVRTEQESVGNPCPPVSSPAPPACGCGEAEQPAAACAVTEHVLRAGSDTAAALQPPRHDGPWAQPPPCNKAEPPATAAGDPVTEHVLRAGGDHTTRQPPKAGGADDDLGSKLEALDRSTSKLESWLSVQMVIDPVDQQNDPSRRRSEVPSERQRGLFRRELKTSCDATPLQRLCEHADVEVEKTLDPGCFQVTCRACLVTSFMRLKDNAAVVSGVELGPLSASGRGSHRRKLSFNATQHRNPPPAAPPNLRLASHQKSSTLHAHPFARPEPGAVGKKPVSASTQSRPLPPVLPKRVLCLNG